MLLLVVIVVIISNMSGVLAPTQHNALYMYDFIKSVLYTTLFLTLQMRKLRQRN